MSKELSRLERVKMWINKKTQAKAIDVDLSEMISIKRGPMSNKSLKTIATALSVGNSTTDIPSIITNLESLSGNSNRTTVGDEERLEISKLWMARAETMYRLDPLIFSSVNKITRLITSPKVSFAGGTNADQKYMVSVIKKLGLRRLTKLAVKDILVYGFAFIEITQTDNGEIDKLYLVDPKTVDYQKNGTKLKLDDEGEIVGYTWTRAGEEKTLPKEKVILLNFFSIGKECMGISPLEPIFKASWIRMNLEEALGEAVYRHGHPIYYFNIGDEERPATPAMVERAREIMSDFQSAAEIFLPHWIKVGVLSSNVNVAQLSELLLMFANQVSAGLEIPKAYGIGVERGGRDALEVQNLDFEKSIICYQADLIEQLEEQLFSKLVKWQDMKEQPVMVFQEVSPEHKWTKVRRLNQLSRQGLISRDDKLEDHLRKYEDLPALGEVKTTCLFGIADSCPIRSEGYIGMKDLSQYCNICRYRIDHENSRPKRRSRKKVKKDSEEKELEQTST